MKNANPEICDKANEAVLSMLHAEIAHHLLNQIQQGKATPQLLSVAIKFLHDNCIKADIYKRDDLKALEEATVAVPKLEDIKEMMVLGGGDIVL